MAGHRARRATLTCRNDSVMIHFDTNFIVQLAITASPANAKFRAWVSAGEICNISTVVWAEFLCGPLNVTDESFARQIFPTPEPLLGVDAKLAAKLFNQSGRRSRSLADCMIAAVAIRCGAKPATINTSDFQPFVQSGLMLC